MRKTLILMTLILMTLTINCERFDYYCWECIQTQTSYEPIDFTFGDKYTYPCGQTEEQIRNFEEMYTYDKYVYLYNDTILTHLTTTCKIIE